MTEFHSASNWRRLVSNSASHVVSRLLYPLSRDVQIFIVAYGVFKVQYAVWLLGWLQGVVQSRMVKYLVNCDINGMSSVNYLTEFIVTLAHFQDTLFHFGFSSHSCSPLLPFIFFTSSVLLPFLPLSSPLSLSNKSFPQ